MIKSQQQDPIAKKKVASAFLNAPDAMSFTDVFNAFRPQLVAFFRARGCELPLAEDLAQEVMASVYFNAARLRDRSLFRAWLFRIARNALHQHYLKQAREVDTVDLADARRSRRGKPHACCFAGV